MVPDGRTPAQQICDKLAEQASQSDARMRNTVAALREELERDAHRRAEDAEKLAQYEDAYNKLSAPAHRVGVFLRWEKLDDARELAMIALGEQEFATEVDPLLDRAHLTAGRQVRVNEAYVVVGVMPPTGRGATMKVATVMDDGRLRVGGDAPGGDGRIVGRSAELKDAHIMPGDEVRVDPNGHLAVEHFQKQESRDYFLETVPEIPWEKVGGQEKAIQLIRDTIEQPLLYPELFKRFDKKPVKGILLYGPPGCGKTLIGKATAHNLTKEYAKRVGHEVREYFMAISGPKILNMWLGETERMVRELFETAREKAKEGRLVFIFMDEAESVLRTRSSGRYLNISNTVVPQFCAELDGLVSLENVVLMLTSNRPDYIDPAVLRPERIDRKVKIGRPDRIATLQIVSIYLHEEVPLDPEVVNRYDGEDECARRELVESLTEHLWRATKDTEVLRVHLRDGTSKTLHWKDLISGALLKSIVERAKDHAIKRSIASPGAAHGVSLEDLVDAAAQEYKENEIFPKSDTTEDWLQLLDYEPENVVSVKPIGRNRGEEIARKGVI